jgi:peptidoglycan/xylan/chitin deacetylase (PgdA/CDA1 family)
MLRVVMYHYIRDFAKSRFPRLHGMPVADFVRQVDLLRTAHEMATLDSALAFLRGEYHPSRPLCLLTFDDGTREHFELVTPILSERSIQGLFFLITGCMQRQTVAHVHQNHFLMADLEFTDYRQRFLAELQQSIPGQTFTVDPEIVAKTYRWDTPEVGVFKYMLNFQLTEPLKNQVLTKLFEEHFGDQAAFSRALYLQWKEAREMQASGMLLGGHTHSHQALATLSDEQQIEDLTQCYDQLQRNLTPQALWPFCYPYGKPNTFNAQSRKVLQELGFACSFSTIVGDNSVDEDRYAIHRVDPKDVLPPSN